MLMQEATKEMISNWKSIYNEYRLKLSPNRKNASQIVDYLKAKYPLTEIMDEQMLNVVTYGILMNNFSSEKLSDRNKLKAVGFLIKHCGNGLLLYNHQDKIFEGKEIFIGIEMQTGYFHVEGSSQLWDELFAFRGLDENDLKNFYLVAEYIGCLKKYGLID